jgi:hypothetical protein
MVNMHFFFLQWIINWSEPNFLIHVWACSWNQRKHVFLVIYMIQISEYLALSSLWSNPIASSGQPISDSGGWSTREVHELIYGHSDSTWRRGFLQICINSLVVGWRLQSSRLYRSKDWQLKFSDLQNLSIFTRYAPVCMSLSRYVQARTGNLADDIPFETLTEPTNYHRVSAFNVHWPFSFWRWETKQHQMPVLNASRKLSMYTTSPSTSQLLIRYGYSEHLQSHPPNDVRQ